jgi:glycosyltransferase involved in cell wall biosynthesis
MFKRKKKVFHFCNTLCSSKVYSDLFNNHNVLSSSAAQNFFLLIARGLITNKNTDVRVNSVIPVNFTDQKKIFWFYKNDKDFNISFKYVPVINIPYLNNLLTSCYLFLKILFSRFPTSDEHFFVFDFLRFSINFPVLILSKIKGFKTLAIVTDLPGESIHKKSIKDKIKNIFLFRFKYDYYVCVTKDLNFKVNPQKKPHVIIESFANIDLLTCENKLSNKFNEKVIVYAGGLYQQYGILSLIEAFQKLSDVNLRLWFYGVGPLVNEIIKKSKNDSRIEYKGVLTNQELLPVLIKSSLLVNPRPTNENYTKYSFPSKNLEFMSVGTPLVTTKLPGIPDDHLPYIYLFSDESVMGIYKTLNLISKINRTDLHEFGIRSKEYTLREKNNVVQAKKIIDLVSK